MADVPENSRYRDEVFTLGRRAIVVTPHDSNNFAELPKTVVNAGSAAVTLVAVDEDGNESTWTLPNMGALPFRPVRINDTGTDATTALYAIYGPAGQI